MPDPSVDFFEHQFRRQIERGEAALNPFEQAALPHLRGDLLDLGCGMGNLALAAARQGARVSALDASPTAIDHLQRAAARERLPVTAAAADLRGYRIPREFDTIVSIGLLMFFDCVTARRALADLQKQVRAGGTAVVNLLVQGTTYLGMFDPAGHCLFEPGELARRFQGWEVLLAEHKDFEAPGGTLKSFDTVIARKPPAARSRP